MMPDEPGISFADSETIKLAITMPSNELKTRADQDPTLSYGSDGLFSFSRTIDKLWYAVYNNGDLLYHSFQPGIPQAVYNTDDKTFSLDIQIPKINEQINLNEYSVFFFAGNALDKVENREITDGIGLDFANKTLYAYPANLSKTEAAGEMFNPQQYDFFARYTTLDNVVDSDYNGNVTLIRPFCQVSLLTDELTQPVILSALATDAKVTVTTTPSVFSQKGTTTTQTLPYAWNYGTDNVLLKDLYQVTFSLQSRAFNNVENIYSIPQEVTFKNRKMFCLASYLMLCPHDRRSYNPGASVEKFNFELSVVGNRNSTATTISADVPTGGLQANEKYVMYNRKFNSNGGGSGDPNDPDDPQNGDDDGKGGEGGLFSKHYIIDVVIDPAWNGGQNIVY